MIFAGEKMAQWSVFGPKRHFTFTNPLPMLEDRVSAVRNLAGEVPVEGRIVFSMRGEFPKGRPDTVLRLDSLQDEFPVVERTAGGAAEPAGPEIGDMLHFFKMGTFSFSCSVAGKRRMSPKKMERIPYF
jgi:hypothetical protein